jgi:endonuclease YncB( thermonuclease family)
MRAAVLALGLASIVLAGSYGPAMAEPIASGRVHVLDGDTIRVDGRRPDVRLVGFNAPETTRAQCAAEGDLGEVAARRLRALVAGGGLDLQFVPCSCAPGTEGTPNCNYGRRCGILQARGRMSARCSWRKGSRCRSNAARPAARRRRGRGAAKQAHASKATLGAPYELSRAWTSCPNT